MNKISTKLLSLMICMELVLAPFPKAFADASSKTPSTNTPQEQGTTAAFFKSVQAEAEFIFDPKTGCAKVGADGNATIINQTTSGAIHGDPEFQTSISCEAALNYLEPRWKKAMDLKRQYEAADKTDPKDKNCSDCSVAAKNLNTNFLVPEGGTCSTNEKKAIAADRKSNDPKCSFENEFGLGKMLSTDCLKSFVESFWTSMVNMVKTPWHAITAVGSYVKGLFAANTQAENAAGDRGLQFAGMSPADVAQAQKDPEAAKRSWAAKVGHAVETLGTWMAENFLLDVPAYKDLWSCSKCGDRGNAVCKMFGVLGKDMVKYALFDLIAGKAIGAVGKAIFDEAPPTTLLGKIAELSGARAGTRAIVKVGSEKFASLGAAAVEGFTKFSEKGVGKFAADYFLKPTWQITKGLGHVALKTNEAFDTVMKAPATAATKIFVSGGKKTATAIGEAAARYDANALEFTGYGLNDAKPLKSVTEITKDPAAIAVETPITKETAPKSLQEAATTVQKTLQEARFNPNWKALKPGTKVDISVNDILNATEEKPEVSYHAISLPPVGEKGETHYFSLNGKNGDDVAQVLGYRDNSSAIIKMKDGSIYLGESGRGITPVAKKDIPKVAALLDQRAQKQVDDNVLKQTEATMDVNGVAHQEVTSSTKAGEKDVEFKTSPECGNQTITVSAGRAI